MFNWIFNLFRGNRNVIVETVEAFRPNAERADYRSAALQSQALQQFSREFSRYNSWVDALNRLPRPLIAFSVIGLFAYAMIQPLGFAARMEALTLVPDQLWQLMSVIVMFYFGARELQHFRASAMAKEAARIQKQAPIVAARIQDYLTPRVASTDDDPDLTIELMK